MKSRIKKGLSIVLSISILLSLISNLSVAYAAEVVDSTYCDWATITACREQGTAPVIAGTEGKVFAGWYVDANYEESLGANEKVEGAYAKFVEDDVLSVGIQFSENTTVESTKTDLRLLTTVDSRYYESAGFILEINGKTVTKEIRKVYPKIYGYYDETEVLYEPSQAFCKDSKYFVAYKLLNIPNSAFATEIKVTPKWTTLDGITITGIERTFTIGSVLEDVHNLTFGAFTDTEETFLLEESGTNSMSDDNGTLRFINGEDSYFTYGIDVGSKMKSAAINVKAGQKYQKIEVSFDGVTWLTFVNTGSNNNLQTYIYDLTNVWKFSENTGKLYVRFSGGEGYTGGFGITVYDFSLSYELADNMKYKEPTAITNEEYEVTFTPFTDEETTFLLQESATGEMSDSAGTFRFINAENSYFIYGVDVGSQMKTATISAQAAQMYQKIEVSFDGETWSTLLNTATNSGVKNYSYNLTDISGFSDNMGEVYVRFSGGDGYTGSFGITLYGFGLNYQLIDDELYVAPTAIVNKDYQLTITPFTDTEATFLLANSNTGEMSDSNGTFRFLNGTGSYFTYGINVGSQMKNAKVNVKAAQMYQKIEVSFDGTTWQTLLNTGSNSGVKNYSYDLTGVTGFSDNTGKIYVKFSGGTGYAGSFGLTLYEFGLTYRLSNDDLYVDPMAISGSGSAETTKYDVTFTPFTDTEATYLLANNKTGKMDDATGTFRFIDGRGAYFTYGIDAGSQMSSANIVVKAAQTYQKILVSFDGLIWQTLLNTGSNSGLQSYSYNLTDVKGFSENTGKVYVKFAGGEGYTGSFGITVYEFALNYSLAKDSLYKEPVAITEEETEVRSAAASIDVVEYNYDDTALGVASARILQGVINKEQARAYIAQEWKENVEEVRQDILATYGDVSLNTLARSASDTHAGYTIFWTLFTKYSGNIEKIFVFSDDETLNDTINVAAMFAARYNGVAVNQELADQIIAAGYDLPVVNIVEYCGFTGDNANALAINQWISDNMVEGANQEMVVALNPTGRLEGETALPTYHDFAVAHNAVIYNAYYIKTTEGAAVQKSILDQYPDNTTVIGWPAYAMETEYVTSVSECGKTVTCIDWSYNNGSVWSAFPAYENSETQADIPDEYAVEDGDIYVAFVTSDGDAWHYATGDFLLHWQDEVRGTQPIGWTVSAYFSIYNPLMLEYIYDTKTDMDDIIMAPSGKGYIYPCHTPDSSYQTYLKNTAEFAPKLGLNIVNAWDMNVVTGTNDMSGDDIETFRQYADVVKPDAIFRGHDSQAMEYDYEVYNGCVIIEEVGNSYGTGIHDADDIVTTIDTISAKTASGKPTFLVINVEAWGDCVAAIQPAIDTINARSNAADYHFVTPGEMVRAIRSYEGVGVTRELEFDAFSDTESTFLVENSGTGQMSDDIGTYRFIDGQDAYFTYGIDAGSQMKKASINVTAGQTYQKIEVSFDGETWQTLLNTGSNSGVQNYTYDLTSVTGFSTNTGKVYARFSGGEGYTGGFGIMVYDFGLTYELMKESLYTKPTAANKLHSLTFTPFTETETTYLLANNATGQNTDGDGTHRFLATQDAYFTYGIDVGSQMKDITLNVKAGQIYQKIEVSFDGISWNTLLNTGNNSGVQNYTYDLTNITGFSANTGKIYVRFSGGEGYTGSFGITVYNFGLTYELVTDGAYQEPTGIE